MKKIFDKDRWTEIWHTIISNKKRSIITSFGVFWGIFMLILLLSAGKGFENGINLITDGVSTNSAFFWTNNTSKAYNGFRSGRSWSLDVNDFENIKKIVPEIDKIATVDWGMRKDKNVSYKEKSGNYSVLGAQPDFFEIISFNMIEGRRLTVNDDLEERKYCMIGSDIKEKLFGLEKSVLGKSIKVNNLYYSIIGVVASKSAVNIGSNPKSTVYIPGSILRKVNKKGSKVENFSFSVHKDVDINPVIEKVTTFLKSRHDIAPDDKAAIQYFNLSKVFQTMNNISTSINLLIWIVGIGTLLTGIVGVSNIMLVTVRERTREIGVRRALGAKPLDIISQILSEATLLTLIAGVTGLILSVFIMGVIDSAIGIPKFDHDGLPFYNPNIPFWQAVISMMIIISGGILGGLLPAYRAIQIKAIDAIRDE
ncbi:ABC transporter permease [Porphyromonas pogonae]|uniref:ABC transporter permease n=1 Tax=Porphyromonas pogonae TaxID=867595 RepID=UPI002E78C066|nr:ABC transporter permease [Porphyromonas pogonae]